MVKIRSLSARQTKSIGQKLGNLLGPGDAVCLYGELGSGKTVFTKGLAGAFGIPERDITSASFTIVSDHEGALGGRRLIFRHIDLYRLESPFEAESIGIEDYLGRDAVSVIEWAERLGEPPAGCIRVSISVVSGQAREIIIEGIDEKDWHNRQRGVGGGRGAS